jgi:hypothetical protein
VEGKEVSIDGQGAAVSVAQPGLSPYRTLSFSFSEGSSGNIALYNLIMKGGDISADVVSTDNEKGGVLFVKRAGLLLKNCTLSDGKANIGGALADGDGSLSLVMEDCTFTGNTATKGSAACGLSFPNGSSIQNCTFENNQALVNGGCSAIDITQTATIGNCLFRNNFSSKGRSGAALSVRKATANVAVENCVFNYNINSGNDGGSAITQQVDTDSDEGSVVKLINCTFYNNRGGRGAVYIYQGEAIVVNCTFAGNKNGNTESKYAGAFYAAQDKQTILRYANNIMAYNYQFNGGAKDYYVPNGSYCTQYGKNNLVAAGEHVVAAHQISEKFDYAASSLFASYTANEAGQKIPEFDEATGAVPLAATSIAIAAGVSSYNNPNLVPAADLRGVLRAVPPCIGSYEYKESSGVSNVYKTGLEYRSENGVLDIVSEKPQSVNLFGIDGRLAARLQLNAGHNSIPGLAEGLYISGNQKIIVRKR